jgi:hypothetical protein
MAFKFETQGNYFIITNTVTTYEILRKVKSDIYLVSNGTRIRFYDITSDQVLPDRDGYEFSQIVDVNGNPFADLATLMTFLNVNTGLEVITAYKIAVNNGFVGTEAQWLLSLKGEQGIQGAQGSGVKITPWTAGTYLLADQVNHLGKDWVSNAATLSTDVPGTSSKWVDRLSKKANMSDVYLTLGENVALGISTLSNKYYQYNGTTATLSGYAASDGFIPVYEGKQYRYIGHIHGSMGVVFYDYLYNIIQIMTPDGTTGLVWENQLFTVPIGAKYMRTSSSNGIITILYEDVNIIKYQKTEDAIVTNNRVTLLETENVKTINTLKKGKINWLPSVTYDPPSREMVRSHVIEMQLFNLTGWTNMYFQYLSMNHDGVTGKFFLSIQGTYGGVDTSYCYYLVTDTSLVGKKVIDLTQNGNRTVIAIDFTGFNLGMTGYNFSLGGFDHTFNDTSRDVKSSLLAYLLNANGLDYETLYPEFIFGTDNDSAAFYTREYIDKLYPESILKKVLPVNINENRSLSIQNNVKNISTKETTVKTIKLDGFGYKSKSQNFNYIKTKSSNAKNKTINLLCIGDSLTGTDSPYPDGTYKGGWGYVSILKEMSLMDNADHGGNINVTNIGTANNATGRSFNYKSVNYPMRSFGEGRGGWATATYLRHAFLLGGYSASGLQNSSGAASWAILGLLTTQVTAFNSTSAHRELIATTVMGKNVWDYDSNIWDYLKQYSQWTGGTGSYTGSVGNKAAIDAQMNYLLDNPLNPFFSKAKAQTVGSTNAFSLTAYLDRYKTLQSNGVTRLVVGSTAGTLVTDINSYDVCLPTHVIIALCENDRFQSTPTSQRVADDIISLSNIISSEYSTINVGIMINRNLGVFYPNKWNDKGVITDFYTGYNDYKFEIMTILKATLGVLATQNTNKKFLLPTYHIQSPISCNSRNSVSLEDMSNTYVTSQDTIHPGILGYWGMANQMLSWIYYTI